jgi:hypothetical protein
LKVDEGAGVATENEEEGLATGRMVEDAGLLMGECIGRKGRLAM